MKQIITVIAARLADPALAGKARVVKEGVKGRYITEETPVRVLLTPYYARRINAGELCVVDDVYIPRPQVSKRRIVQVLDKSEAEEPKTPFDDKDTLI